MRECELPPLRAITTAPPPSPSPLNAKPRTVRADADQQAAITGPGQARPSRGVPQELEGAAAAVDVVVGGAVVVVSADAAADAAIVDIDRGAPAASLLMLVPMLLFHRSYALGPIVEEE